MRDVVSHWLGAYTKWAQLSKITHGEEVISIVFYAGLILCRCLANERRRLSLAGRIHKMSPVMGGSWSVAHPCSSVRCWVNSLRPTLNRRPFADDIFKCNFLNANEWILPRISLKFVPKVRINNIPALVQIMVWRLPGDKPLSEPMMVSLLTDICVTRPQWVKPSLKSMTQPPSSSSPSSSSITSTRNSSKLQLTRCGLVMPYGTIDPGEYWLG